jgi:hypothetical protein
MIELRITHCYREAGRDKPWYRLKDTTHPFASLREAKAWCRAHLSPRFTASFRDTTDGGAQRCGRVYAGRPQVEHHRTYYRQYWVDAYEVVRVPFA